jgi:sortase (surface protein transpeptidase)
VALRRSNNSLFANTCLFLVGLGLIIFSAIALWDWFSHTQGTAKPPENKKIITYSTDTPDEKPVPQESAYSVPADQPKRILIPSISTEGFIQRVGKDQYNAVGVPANIHFAGWYVESVKPGDTGLSVIDGHVSSRYGSALFAKLGKMQQNDIIQIEFGNNSVRQFQVVDKRELPETQTAKYLLAKREDIDQQLNLVTCGGTFNKTSDKYNNRLVIVSKRIK